MTAPRPAGTPRPLDRRRFLAGAGVLGGAALLGPSVLAACGSSSSTTTTSAAGGSATTSGGGNLVVANWPYYIDPNEIPLFQDTSKIAVEYLEEVNDNDEWYAKYAEQLKRGEPIGRDIAVLTDWMAARMIRDGQTETIDKAKVPNAANIIPALASPSWDPQRSNSLPWLSGITGIAYNPAATGFEIRSVNDLFDPRLKGRVTMLTEMRDTLGLVMLGMGIDPSKATVADAEAATAKVAAAKADGQIRKFTGNDYGADLVQGNVAAAMAWSGDVVQLQADAPDLQFVVPDEGGMLFSDNMLIPAKAANRNNAFVWMNHFYDPVVAARLVAFTQFVSPVKGAMDELAKLPDGQALVDNPLVNPTAEVLGRLKVFKGLSEAEEQQFNQMYVDVIRA